MELTDLEQIVFDPYMDDENDTIMRRTIKVNLRLLRIYNMVKEGMISVSMPFPVPNDFYDTEKQSWAGLMNNSSYCLSYKNTYWQCGESLAQISKAHSCLQTEVNNQLKVVVNRVMAQLRKQCPSASFTIEDVLHMLMKEFDATHRRLLEDPPSHINVMITSDPYSTDDSKFVKNPIMIFKSPSIPTHKPIITKTAHKALTDDAFKFSVVDIDEARRSALVAMNAIYEYKKKLESETIMI